MIRGSKPSCGSVRPKKWALRKASTPTNAPRQLLEHLRQCEPLDLQLQNTISRTVEADQMKGVFADIDTNH